MLDDAALTGEEIVRGADCEPVRRLQGCVPRRLYRACRHAPAACDIVRSLTLFSEGSPKIHAILTIQFPRYSQGIVEMMTDHVEKEALRKKKKTNIGQSKWGAKLFLGTLLSILLFFWWLLIYSGGAVVHHG